MRLHIAVIITAMTVMALVCSVAPGQTDQAAWMRPDLEPMPTAGQIGQTWVEIGGQIYGAQADELGPIGGGEGYGRIVTTGDYIVTTPDELIAALEKAQAGQVVFLAPTGDFDFTSLVFAGDNFVLSIPAGVTVASDRGHNGSRGAVVYSDNYDTCPLMAPAGPDVRLTGLWLRGPDPQRQLEHHRKAYGGADAPGSSYYYKLPVSDGIMTRFDGLEVDNCEVSGWSHGGVHLWEGTGHHVHHCYIHHCQRNGLGYGVVHGYGEQASSLIERNLFDANRHSIAATGKPGNAYEACHNVELGVSLSHCFDMHGGADRQDGTSIAGDWMKIHHNTFRAPIRAIAIRGVPQGATEIYGNWFFQPAAGANTIAPWPVGGDTNIAVYDNAYGLDSPVLGDERKGSFREAYEAGDLAWQGRDVALARLWFSQALELACTDVERASAHLRLGHCAMSDRLDYLATAHYRATVALSAAASQMRPDYCTPADPLAFATADRLAAADLLTEAAGRLHEGYSDTSRRPANLSVPRYQNQAGLSDPIVAAADGGGYSDRRPDALGARRYRQAIMTTAAQVGKRTECCPKTGQPAYSTIRRQPSVTSAWDMASYPHPSFAGVNDWHRYSTVTQPPLPAVATRAQQREAAVALDRLDRIAHKRQQIPAREWTLAFEDSFDRAELGDDWQVLIGEWAVDGGELRNAEGHSEIMLARPLSGLLRLEFEVRADASDRLCDFSPAIHSRAGVETLREGGYLLQFGGAANTMNRILRDDEQLEERAVPQMIEPGRWYTVAAELDGDMVRLQVDGRTIVEARDCDPLIGAGQDRVGLYFYGATRVRTVRVYSSGA